MLTRWLLAAGHLLALAIGFGAIVVRGSAFQDILEPRNVRRVLRADNWWGISALLWFATGLARVLRGTEKPTVYYTGSLLFWIKMGLFALILLLELGPMFTLIQWRRALGRGETPNTTGAARLARISFLQAALLVLMVLAATALARGYVVVLPL